MNSSNINHFIKQSAPEDVRGFKMDYITQLLKKIQSLVNLWVFSHQIMSPFRFIIKTDMKHAKGYFSNQKTFNLENPGSSL